MLALKGNQPRLLQAAEDAFASAGLTLEVATHEHGHGRTDRRFLTALDCSPEDPACAGFPGLQQIFRIERERTNHRTGNTTREVTYAITNADRQRLPPTLAAQVIRQHWRVENDLHRQKDVRMKEDQSTVRTRNAPHNLATLRNLALAVIRLATARGASHAQRWKTVAKQPWRAYKVMNLVA